jgi:hypothetical protein
VLLAPAVPQPDGALLYELLTGHPDRTPQQLVFLADLAVELRAWPADTWAKAGVDPQAAAAAVIAGWRRGVLPGRQLGGLTAQEALALERPAMTFVWAQLAARLGRHRVTDRGRLVHVLGRCGPQPPGLEGEAGSAVAVVSLPAEDGRRRRPPAGPALSS